MVRNREEAALASLKQTRNDVGTCQKTTREWLGAPSAGDRDGDRDADANDGWASEPKSARRFTRTGIPRGVPVYLRNKSGRGFGHRMLSLGGGKFRSTDMSNGRYAPGATGTVTLTQVENAMGLEFVGWSTTITGIPIPPAPAPAPPKVPTVSKKSEQFKISTCNLQSLPKLKSIAKGMATTDGTHFRGFQEADLKEYKLALFKKFPHIVGIGTLKTPRNNTYSSPIVYSRVLADKLFAKTVKLYDGESGISYTRHATYAGYRLKKTKQLVAHVNLHSVVIKADRKAKRLEMKEDAKAATFASVRDALKHGYSVIVTGDFNDKTNWFGTKFEGHKVTAVKNGINQVIVIDGAHSKWTVDSHRAVPQPGDHDTLRAKVTLTEK